MVKTILIGVDEAGRGPLIGDLVVALVALLEEDVDFLRGIGVKDSKELSPMERSELISFIYSRALFVSTTHIPAPYVDLFVANHALNKLEATIMIKMLKVAYNRLNAFNAELTFRVYIDEVKGYDEYIYSSIRSTYGSKLMEFRSQPGADKKYVAVSAASIVAKFHRDASVNSIKTIYGDFGSGYPSDPKTREWVLRNYSIYRNPPPIVRKTWGTLRRIAPEWHMDFKKRTLFNYIKK